jgi:CheY-like chemotaxis protein
MEPQMSRNGYNVTAVPNGRMAVELIQKDPNFFDVLLLDLEMPEMSMRSHNIFHDDK